MCRVGEPINEAYARFGRISGPTHCGDEDMYVLTAFRQRAKGTPRIEQKAEKKSTAAEQKRSAPDMQKYRAKEGSPEWKKGSLVYVGWPDMPERELRVCLRVVPRKTSGIPAGVFCRADDTDAHCYGVNQPLIWLILNSEVDKVIIYVF